MKQYTIYCTNSQARKALSLGAPIGDGHYYDRVYVINTIDYAAPTAEQMISWLEEKGLLISITARNTPDNPIYNYNINRCEESWSTFSSRQEATLAAIDAALEYLINNNK